jgi:2-isopropylmalate synthase
MSTRIKFFDTTLRDGEQTPGVNLNRQEKLEIALQLERLGVDTIEAGFPIASVGDFEAVREIARRVKSVRIAGLARALEKDIDRAYEAVREAADPMIHTFLATSDIHMKYKLKMTEEEVLERAVAMVRYARNLCGKVEFSPEDAGRTRPEFLYKVVEAVIKAGASVVNIPDTVGYTMPSEFGKLIKGIMVNVPNVHKADISVHCHNDLGLATANTLAAIENGATQVECTINGLGERAGNAALEEIVMALNTRKDLFDFTHGINTMQINRSSKLVCSITGINVQPNKAIVGANAFAHESGIHQHGILSDKSTYEIMTPESIGLTQNKMVLGKHSGRHAFIERLKELGYVDLDSEQIERAFEKFKELADKKKVVLDNDIEAFIGEKVSEVPEIYQLESFQISSGNKVVSTATISLKKEENTITEAATGSGPIDAAFNAMERVVGINLELEDYSLKAVTEGKDALGEVTVRVSANGTLHVGRGVSTDIIEASIKAYLNAINKMMMNGNGKVNTNSIKSEGLDA